MASFAAPPPVRKIRPASSTTVIKKDTRQAEIKSKGILRLDENGRIYIETEDFGVMDILAFIDELELRDKEVELRIAEKAETTEDIDPLAI